MFIENVKPNKHNVIVYCLVNFNSTLEEDLHRIYTLKEIGIQPYVMIYDKDHCDTVYRKLQRYVNAPQCFWSTKSFDDYIWKER